MIELGINGCTCIAFPHGLGCPAVAALQIPGPLPERDDNYVTDDPLPWVRFDGTRTAHTGVNLYGSGYQFMPRGPIALTQWYAWWEGVQAAVNRWHGGRGTPMINPYPRPDGVPDYEVVVKPE